MSRATTTNPRGESGQALPLVLILLLFTAVVSIAVLNLVFGNFRAARVDASLQERVQAVSGGLDLAIQEVRGGSAACFAGSPTRTFTIAARDVQLSCARTAASTELGPGGWALYVNNTGAGSVVTTQAASNDIQKVIKGPVYNGSGDVGWAGNADLQIQRGQLVHSASSCTGLFPNFGGRTVTAVGFASVLCRTVALPSAPADTLALLGAAPATINPAPVNVGGPNCKRFSPGQYTIIPVLGARNSFSPGVYYFNFAGATPAVKLWTITQEVVVGAPADGQLTVNGASACASVAAGNTVFVFGGDSRIEIGNSGSLEIFSDAANPRIPNAAVMGQYSGGPGWIAAPTVFPHKILGFDLGVGGVRKLAVHGVTYAPRSKVQLVAGNNAIAKLLSSVVIASLDLQAPNSISPDSFGIFSEANVGSSSNRFRALSVVIGTEKQLCAHAEVTFAEDADESAVPPVPKTVVTNAFRIDNRLTSACAPV